MSLKYTSAAAVILCACFSLSACNVTENAVKPAPVAPTGFTVLDQNNAPLTNIILSTGVAQTNVASHNLLGSTDSPVAGSVQQVININYAKTESKPGLSTDNKLPTYIKVIDKGQCAAKDPSKDACQQFAIQYTPQDVQKNDFKGSLTFANDTGRQSVQANMSVPAMSANKVVVDAANAPAILPTTMPTLLRGNVVYSDDLTRFKIHINTLDNLKYNTTGLEHLNLQAAVGNFIFKENKDNCSLSSLGSHGCDLSFDITQGATVDDNNWHYGLNDPVTLYFSGKDEAPGSVLQKIYPFVTHDFFVGSKSSTDPASTGFIMHAGTGVINQGGSPSKSIWTTEHLQLGEVQKISSVMHIDALHDSSSIHDMGSLDSFYFNPLNFYAPQQPVWESFAGPLSDGNSIVRLSNLLGTQYTTFPVSSSADSDFQVSGSIVAVANSGTPEKHGNHNYFVYLSSQNNLNGASSYYVKEYEAYSSDAASAGASPKPQADLLKTFTLSGLSGLSPKNIHILVSGDGSKLMLAGFDASRKPVMYTGDLTSQSGVLEMKHDSTVPAPNAEIQKWVVFHDVGYNTLPHPGNRGADVLLGLSHDKIYLYRYRYTAVQDNLYQSMSQTYNLNTPFSQNLTMIDHVACTSESFDNPVAALPAAQQRRCFFYGIKPGAKDLAFDVEVYRGLDEIVDTSKQKEGTLYSVARTPVNASLKDLGGFTNMVLDADTGNLLLTGKQEGQVYIAQPRLSTPQGQTTPQLNYHVRDMLPAQLPTGNLVASSSVH